MLDSTNNYGHSARLRIIDRPRLARLLDAAAASSMIIMLIAPGGYGKTTLARQWMLRRQHAWYRGTTASSDVAALANQLSQAVQPFVPGAGERMLHRLRATGTPEQDVVDLAELLAEDLEAWPADTWLTFDDYQCAAESVASERFMEILVASCPVRLFLTSRNRPSWATSRRLLDGEIYELGRNLLAMSRDEASKVLAHLDATKANGLAALAEGWPAVIGLAALVERFEPPDGSLPDGLHEYFAEELYQAASPQLQTALAQLRVIPTITAELAEIVLGPGAKTTMEEGVRLGLLTSPQPGTYDVHPLLRDFLDAKFKDDRRAAHDDEMVSRVVLHLVKREQWDDAFAAASQTAAQGTFVSLIETSMPHLLRDSRLKTLKRWILFASSKRITSPSLDLLEAEVAFREGSKEKAEHLALHAAAQLTEHATLGSHAYSLAGRVANLKDHNRASLEYYGKALELATTDTERREALRGKLTTAAKLELDSVSSLFEELVSLHDGSPESIIAVATARYTAACRIGELKGLRDTYRSGMSVLDRVQDPVLRTSFLNGSAQVLSSLGRYEEAVTLTEKTLADASEARLTFVLPYAKITAAAAHTGLKNFVTATRLLDEVGAVAEEEADAYLLAEVATRRARLLLAQGLADQALWDGLEEDLPATHGERGEFLATQALARACIGDSQRAQELSSAAEAITSSPQVRVLVPCLRAILDLKACGAGARAAAEHAFSETLRICEWDAFVCAYRAYPPLVRVVAERLEWRRRLGEVLLRAQDEVIARKLKLPLPRRPRSPDQVLTPRELEVLELLKQGLANKEISRILFISESTAKVHVRHICEKLGVRSRTEAAVKGVVGSG